MSSNIWKIGLYKKLQGGQEAECLLCNNHEKKLTISTKNWASSGLLSHLKAKHKGTKFYEEFVRLESDAPIKGSIEKFMNITSGGGLSCTDKRVINYIVCTLTSFCHLNNPTTRAFCRDALKDESHYRKNVLPKVYAAVKQKILVEVNEFEHLSFTTDIWSGPKDSYISLTAHGISKNWEKRSFVLSVSAFPGSHTGDRINEMVRGLLKLWDIPLSKTHVFMRDGGANMKKAFECDEMFRHLDCGAHLINLVVKDSLKHPPVSLLLSKCRHIVGHFKHSNLAVEEFRQRSCAAFLIDAFEEIMSSADQPGTSAAQQHSQPDLRKEFMDYAARPREPLSANPLEFWRSAEKEFPLLSQAARRFLSPPCTSVLSEQIFSSARDLFHYRRMRTGPKKRK